jgi:hypothetical protein
LQKKNRNYPFDVGNGSLRFAFFLLTLLRRTDRFSSATALLSLLRLDGRWQLGQK